jgi:hypothetical protein
MGKTMNGDTPNQIKELVRESFWMAAARTEEQGRMLRMLEKVNITAEKIGRKGGYSHLCKHIARSHTQNWYRDEEKSYNESWGCFALGTKIVQMGVKPRPT